MGEIGRLTVAAEERSADGGTEKRLFRLRDGETIETVLMRYEERNTLCISSQVGCAMGCVFCATGQMGFRRNLTAGEIIAQVLAGDRELRQVGQRVTNIVLMGMGEPLLNYDAVMAAIRRLVDPTGFKLGARRITLSTIGLVRQIRRLAGEGLPVGLAISLHAATDEERRRLIPAARRWSVAEVVASGAEYAEATGRRVTFEWALIQGENDGPEQAHALGNLVAGMLCHVNLIPLNPTRAYCGKGSNARRVQGFQRILSSYGIPNTVRVRRGGDIQAGCGQLRQRES
jgi:23S rRNA (adenine2503-C2)-methyltransferase